MRSARLLVVLSFFFTCFSGKLFGQTFNGFNYNIPLSLDSLAGFDESAAKLAAIQEGVYGENLKIFLFAEKRLYINKKYNLVQPAVPHPQTDFWLNSGSKTIGNVNSVNVAPCVNEGFELGNTTGWTGRSGQNIGANNSCNYATTAGNSPTMQVVTTPFNDPNISGLTIANSPFPGNKCVRLNDALPMYGVTRISQTFPVTSSNFLYEFAYQAVMATGHICCEQTYMQVRLYNLSSLQPCPNFTFAPPPSGPGSCSYPGITWNNTTVGGLSVAYNPAWQKYSLDLTAYISSTVTIEVTLADCSQSAHWGYAYFDSNCSELGFTINNTTFVSAPTTSVNLTGNCAQVATITAPGGLGPYLWEGSTGTLTTNQTLTTGIAGTYTITMTPPGACGSIKRIINLSFPPPTTLTASPAQICASGPTTLSVLNAVGASQYTWQPGGATTATLVVTPTITTIYTVTARTGTCLGTYTLQVTVNPDPVFNVVASSAALCPGQTGTLTAISSTSNSYVWNPGSMTGSVVTITQTSPTTYTTIATSTAGCTSTVQTTIGTAPAPNISIILFPGTQTYVCRGTPVTLIATGGAITWYPGGSNNPVETFNPLSTTVYTAVGANGSCTNSAVQTISVNPGPSMTLTANPAATCPGNTTTLSVTAPSAVGAFTWNPGSINAPSIVVTPTISGGYSVTAADAMGCRNTQTINPTISPLPTISITPPTPTVCEGTGITLTANGGTSYTWMPGGSTSNPVTFTPTSTQTYSVIGANAANCTVQAMVTVTVVSSPTVNATVNPTAICAGSCASITPTGAQSYNISGGSFLVCPPSSSVYVLTGTNSAGCASAPFNVSVTVNPLPVVTATASPATICRGNSSNLSAGGAVSYTWTNGSTPTVAASVVVSPLSTQTYTVFGESAFGCVSQTVVTVNVIPTPTINVTPSSATICPGGSVNANASGGTSYTWMPGNLSGANQNLSPGSTTTYTITGSNGVCSSQTVMAVNVAPTPVITATFLPGTICAGNCATLSATGTVTNYIVTGVSSPVACPVTTSNYTVVGISSDGCPSNTVTGTIFVNNGPTLVATTSPATICPGGNSTLNGSGATSYTWTDGSTPTVAASVVVAPLATQNYTLIGANATGCTTQTVVTVNVNTPPTINVTPSSATICPGGSVNANASGGTSYTWMPGNLSGANQNLSPGSTTTYTITGSNGICSSQTQMIVTVAPTPVITATFLPGTICAGNCATLSATGTVTNYIVTGVSSPVACPVTTSNYTVVGISSDGCPSNTVTGTIFVNNGPTLVATTSPATICPGGNSTLSGSGATSYTWTDGSTPTVAASVVVAPLATQNYTLIGANATGCTTQTVVTVNVNTPPTINVTPSSATICPGGSVNANASGGTSYTWMPGNLSGANQNLSPGSTTTYTITGSNGICSSQTQMIVTVAPTPVITATFLPGTICAGNCATLSATGTVTNYIVTGVSSPVACPAATSNYTVVGISSDGCPSNTVTGTIFVNNGPTLVATTSPATICPGGNSTLNGSGATSYTWTDGSTPTVATSVVVAPLATQNYTLIGANATGCTTQTVVTVNVNTPPTINVTPSSATICPGGSVNANASGGTSYTWMPGNLSGANQNLSPGSTTTYTITGSNGICSGQTFMTVTVDTPPALTASFNPPSVCAGNCATLTTSGVVSFTISGLSSVACPLSSTPYTVTGSNANGCLSSPVVGTLVVNNAPVLMASAAPATICLGDVSTLSASGAVTYTWTNGVTSTVSANVNVSPNSTTTYSVIGSSGVGCTSQTFVTVAVNSNPTVNVNPPSAVICAGGTINPTANGASTYTWLPGGATGASPVLSPGATGNYTVIGANGSCTTQAIMSVTVNAAPAITATYVPGAICAGNCATLNATGTVTNYIVTGLANPVACPAATSNYSVYGVDINGCTSNTVTGTLVVNNSSPVSASASPATLCPGGSSTLTASGAVTYTWTDGVTTTVAPSLTVAPSATTTYTLLGANASGCTSQTVVTVTVPVITPLTATASPATICAGASSTLSASGSTGYFWMPGALSGPNVFVFPSATTVYTVTGTTSGCPVSATVLVTVDPSPTVNISASSASICAGDAVTMTLTGASTYLWDDNSNLAVRTLNLSSTRTFTVIGFSASGCPSTPAVITINVGSVPNVTAVANPNALCAGASAVLSANGAATYTWQPGTLTGQLVTVSPTNNTTYTVTGTAANGCSATAVTTVSVSTPISVSVNNTPPGPYCVGDVVTLTAGGASTYTWLPGPLPSAPSITVSPASTTTYTLMGATGACTAMTTVTVTMLPTPVLTVNVSSNTICAGNCATLTASGASSYTWSNGPLVASNTVCPLNSTSYTVFGSNGGCVTSSVIAITVNSIPTVNISSNANPICSGSFANLTASGASTYSWSNGSTLPTINVSPASTTVYTVTGYNGPCSNTTTYTLNVIPANALTVTASSPSVCSGFTVSLLAQGGTSYTWTPGNSTNNPFVDSPLSSTVYTVSADNSGCISTATIGVTVNPLPSVSITANPASLCAGTTLTLTASGAATYTWIPSLQGGNVFTDNPTTTTSYTVVGYSAAGCPSYTDITVPVVPAPNITVTASSPSVCLGSTATLTALGATNYTWLPLSFTGSQVVVFQSIAGTYTVLADNGGCVTAGTVAVGIYTLPIITASASNPTICPGNTVTLTGMGGISYTWAPPTVTGNNVVYAPIVTTTYNVNGEDAKGCVGSGTVLVTVTPMGGVTIAATPTAICEGNTATLTASGGLTYTWNPGGSNSGTIVVTPTISTTYTLNVDDGTCLGAFPVPITVYPNPTITVAPANATICAGAPTSFTATGASNYTWLPSGATASVVVESPTLTTNYTVLADNGGLCATSYTFDIFVNPAPQHVAATSIGTITCVNPSATLIGVSSDTNVSYAWTGPSGFNANTPSVTVNSVWGNFTLTVTDNQTGCATTATVDIPSDNSIPSVTATVSGTITCAVTEATLNAAHTTTNAGYSWTGPGGFSSSAQSPTVTVAGVYTITVTDLSSTCTGTALVTVDAHTTVPVTATLIPPTCDGLGGSNNNGSITVSGFATTDKYDIVSGSSYTGTATYASAPGIPTNSVLVSNLANPSTTLAYSIRFFDQNGCTKDTTLFLNPTDCSLNTLGIAKAVSAPERNADGSYNLTYTLVVKNYDTGVLKDIALTENLANTFPSPTSFTVITDSLKTISGATLDLNMAFNGSSQTNLLNSSATNSLLSQDSTVLQFKVRVRTPLFFTAFNNSVFGSATNAFNKTIVDSSNAGLNPDPDKDKNPYNNNAMTSVIFQPHSFFGITKVGEIHKSDDDSYDITYTVTIHNLGNDTIRNVVLKDSLFAYTIPNPANYSIRSGPVSTGGGLVANSSYDGNTNSHLINPALSKMPPNTIGSVYFTINVVSNGVTRVSNKAFGSALAASSLTSFVTVTDTSNAGSNPDTNNNGIWNEAVDNMATVLEIPVKEDFFIPQGFSPDGDNINDFFVIQGLPDSGENAITIFNRWGNKVYVNSNYDNTWNGTPNTGPTLGKDKLPPGTYYYILEMKGSGKKPITGFIVLQY